MILHLRIAQTAVAVFNAAKASQFAFHRDTERVLYSTTAG